MAQKRKKDITVDWHAHVMLEKAMEFTQDHIVVFNFKKKPRKAPISTGAHGGMVWGPELDKRIKALDKAGIDVQVLSSSNVHQCCDWAPARDALRVHKLLNDTFAEMIQAHPDRFAGLATVPLQNVPMAIKELDRAILEKGLHGVNMSSNINGVDLDHEKFHPFWKRAEELGVPIYIHPAGATDPRLARYYLWNSMGQPYEEGMAMTSLILGGVMDKFPDLNFVMAHGGGTLPHYDGRLERNYRRGRGFAKSITAPPSEYFKRFYYDTCVYNPEVLTNLAKKVGAGRLIMGSDYPIGELDPIGFVRKNRSLTTAAKKKIVGGTAARLLKLSG
ncbi:MAG: amidohydrolase family protein [Proteobacteria bacterium]|nr:amidohydrolase family protein [Pseudomonadota bacterium]